MPDFEVTSAGFVLRVRLTQEDAGNLYAAALRRGWGVEGFAQRIVLAHLEAERVFAMLPEEPLS